MTEEPTLYDVAKRYVTAVEWDESRDDAFGEADVDYAKDMLLEFVRELEGTKNVSNTTKS